MCVKFLTDWNFILDLCTKKNLLKIARENQSKFVTFQNVNTSKCKIRNVRVQQHNQYQNVLAWKWYWASFDIGHECISFFISANMFLLCIYCAHFDWLLSMKNKLTPMASIRQKYGKQIQSAVKKCSAMVQWPLKHMADVSKKYFVSKTNK